MHHLEPFFETTESEYENEGPTGGARSLLNAELERASSETPLAQLVRAELESGEASESFEAESDEFELAAELVGANDEAELYEAVRHAARAGARRRARRRGARMGQNARRRGPPRPGVVSSPRERMLERLLMAVARRNLPTAVHIAPAGVHVTSSAPAAGKEDATPASAEPAPDGPETPAPDEPAAAATPGEVFGAELDELEADDQAFEAAVRFARFASEAAERLDETPASVADAAAVQAAAAKSAESHAPGLLREMRHRAQPRPPRLDAGRWVRARNQIILYGV